MKLQSKQLATSVLLAIATLGAYAETETISFAEAYEKDSRWPPYVTPSETIVFEDGTSLSASIPTVFSRAYDDGTLVLVDRIGTVFVDHAKTDFIKQINDQVELPDGEQNYNNFIRQLGRRVFDLSHSITKAVPESKLSEFDSFLVCKTEMNPEAIAVVKERVFSNQKWLTSHNCRPVIVFENSVPNETFYHFLKTNDVLYPVVVPIFTKGFIDFAFTERESNANFLWINKNGKLLAKGGSLDELMP